MRRGTGALAWTGAVVGALSLTGAALAQPGEGGRRGGGMQLPSLLGEDAPKVGEQIPDVEVYTAEGERIRMRDLPGKHRVIVFGCLT